LIFPVVVITASGFRRHAEGRRWPFGHDTDDAGVVVLAEQFALGTFQDFDLFDLTQVAETDAVSWAIDAVDHDADRRLQSWIVADRTNAADAGSRYVLGGGGGDGQARVNACKFLMSVTPRP